VKLVKADLTVLLCIGLLTGCSFGEGPELDVPDEVSTTETSAETINEMQDDQQVNQQDDEPADSVTGGGPTDAENDNPNNTEIRIIRAIQPAANQTIRHPKMMN